MWFQLCVFQSVESSSSEVNTNWTLNMHEVSALCIVRGSAVTNIFAIGDLQSTTAQQYHSQATLAMHRHSGNTRYLEGKQQNDVTASISSRDSIYFHKKTKWKFGNINNNDNKITYNIRFKVWPLGELMNACLGLSKTCAIIGYSKGNDAVLFSIIRCLPSKLCSKYKRKSKFRSIVVDHF